MRYATMMLLFSCLLAASITSAAADPVLDCSRRSLADAVHRAHEQNRVITFTGTCAGPIVIQLDGLELRGVGNAVIDGGGHDAVTIAGASGVVLTGIEVRNGRNGIVGVNGAHLSLSELNVRDNTGFRSPPAATHSSTIASASST
jgi:nitrous oxidase accessory protein NosD